MTDKSLPRIDLALFTRSEIFNHLKASSCYPETHLAQQGASAYDRGIPARRIHPLLVQNIYSSIMTHLRSDMNTHQTQPMYSVSGSTPSFRRRRTLSSLSAWMAMCEVIRPRLTAVGVLRSSPARALKPLNVMGSGRKVGTMGENVIIDGGLS